VRQKLAAVLMLLSLLLSSCGAGETVLRDALTFRERLLEADGCAFLATVSAEVQERGYIFSLQTRCMEETASATVLAPDSIAGISATITALDASVCFDGVAVEFGTMDDVMTSPLYLPWLLNVCWRSGYIDCAGMDGDRYRVTYLWGTGEEELILETWFLDELPVRAEVYRKDHLLLSADLEGFTFGA